MKKPTSKSRVDRSRSSKPSAELSSPGIEIDYRLVASQWLRQLRGRRSQVAFSRKLGYQSNIAYRWETGRCWPNAVDTLAMIDKYGTNVTEGLKAFYGKQPPWLLENEPISRAGVAAFLDDLRGQSSITDVARRARVSRFAVGRWLSGEAIPRLPEFLLMVQACSRRLLDFCAALVNPAGIPALEPAWNQLTAARRLAYESPWSQAVLRALELEHYATMKAHEPGWLAAKLGIAEPIERACLESLLAADQVVFREGKYEVNSQPFVDTRADAKRARQLKASWLEVGRQRLLNGAPGMWAYNLFSISSKDLTRLEDLHRAYFREMQRIVSESTPGEHVALFCAQLFPLDEFSSREAPTSFAPNTASFG